MAGQERNKHCYGGYWDKDMNMLSKVSRVFALFFIVLPFLAGCSAKMIVDFNRQQWQQHYQPLPYDEKIDARVVVTLADTSHLGEVVYAWFEAAKDHMVPDLQSLFSQPLDTPDGTEQLRLLINVEAPSGGIFAPVFPMRVELADNNGQQLAETTVQYQAYDDGFSTAAESIRQIKEQVVEMIGRPEVAAVLTGEETQGVMLARGAGAQGMQAQVDRGIYALEEEIAFNVLDRVAYDPDTGSFSLMGHFDAAYRGARIPYLQHLAELLENPKPSFSLEWTEKSEAAVDSLRARLENSAEMARLASMPERWFDGQGRPTEQGAMMLKMFGTNPVRTGGRAGRLGVDGRPQSDNPGVVVTRVYRGSAAERAGIRPGDKLFTVDGLQPWHMGDVIRTTRRAGAGTRINIDFWRGDDIKSVSVVLDAASGNFWHDMTRYDVIAVLFEMSGHKKAASALDYLQRGLAIQETQIGRLYYEIFADSLGVRDEFLSALRRLHKGQVSKQEGMRQSLEVILQGLERALEMSPGSLTVPFNNYTRSMGPELALEEVFGTPFERALEPLFTRVLQDLLHNKEQIVVDLGMIEELTGARPVVHPQFIGVDPSSQLARVLFQADYLGKALIVNPEVGRKIAGLKTEYAYRLDNPGPRGEVSRMWIDVAGMDLALSSDQNVLETRKVSMRFNVRTGRQENFDPYGEHLTAFYDELARIYPAYHELREAAKVLAAARWLKTRDPELTMPKTGRHSWRPPARVDGQVLLIWSPQSSRVVFNAPGGALLDLEGVPPIGPLEAKVPIAGMPVTMDTSVVDLQGLKETPILLAPEPPAIPAIKKQRPMFVEPPPPRPNGWVARAGHGRKVMQALTVRSFDDFGCAPSRAARLNEALARTEALAAQLDRTERAVNAITGQNPENLLQRQEMRRELIDAREEFKEAAIELASQGLVDAADMVGRKARSARSLHELMEGADALKDGYDQITGWQDRIDKLQVAWQSFTTDDTAAMQRSIKDGLDLLKDLGDELAKGGTGPLAKGWKAAGKTVETAKQALLWAKIGKSLLALGNAQILTNRLDPKVAAEAQALRDTLLPLMEDQRQELNAALAEPDVKAYLDGNFDCR